MHSQAKSKVIMSHALSFCRAFLTAFLLVANLAIAAFLFQLAPAYPRYRLGCFNSDDGSRLSFIQAIQIVSLDVIVVGLFSWAITKIIMGINEIVLSNTIENYDVSRKIAMLFTALVTLSLVIGFIIGVVSGFRERVAF